MGKLLLSVLILALFSVTAGVPSALAQDAGFTLKAPAEMRDVLAENVGKRIALRLTSGEEIEGTVTTVGKSLVHISRLAGKEFYDAVVSIEKISAARMRVRER